MLVLARKLKLSLKTCSMTLVGVDFRAVDPTKNTGSLSASSLWVRSWHKGLSTGNPVG